VLDVVEQSLELKWWLLPGWIFAILCPGYCWSQQLPFCFTQDSSTSCAACPFPHR